MTSLNKTIKVSFIKQGDIEQDTSNELHTQTHHKSKLSKHQLRFSMLLKGSKIDPIRIVDIQQLDTKYCLLIILIPIFLFFN